MPEITFIIPAYNAAVYLRQAIRSVLEQTISDWLMIIIDDGSSDETPTIADEFASSDSRIKVIHNPSPSGCAYQARLTGVLNACTPIIAPLDADDIIPPSYLEELLQVKRTTGASAVYPLLHLFSSDKQPTPLFYPPKTIVGRPISGKEAFKFTLDGWRVTCGGGIIDRAIYLEAIECLGREHTDSNADETLTRQLMLMLPSVVFTCIPYLYRINSDSVTHLHSIRRLEILKSCIDVQEMALRNFPDGSEEHYLARRQLFNTYFDCIKIFHTGRFKELEYSKGINMLTEARRHIDLSKLKGRSGAMLRMLFPLPIPLTMPLYAAYCSLRKIKGVYSYFARNSGATESIDN